MKNNSRQIALKLMLEQLEKTYYSLEGDEYSDLTMEEIESIGKEISKVTKQFEKRYNL